MIDPGLRRVPADALLGTARALLVAASLPRGRAADVALHPEIPPALAACARELQVEIPFVLE